MKPSKLLSILFFLNITFSYAQVPPNNDCTNAETIVVTTTEALSLSADFTEATVSLSSSCFRSRNNNRDLWYQFVMPLNGNLYINESSFSSYSLYNTCSGEELACSEGGAVFGNLTNGETYLLRISYRFTGNRTFTLQAFEPAANNECVNKETLTLSTTTPTQITSDSRAASRSSSSSCESNQRYYVDLWYDFVMPVAGNLSITPSESGQIYSLYDVCLGTELQCLPSRRNNVLIFPNLSLNTTYVLKVADDVQNVGVLDFEIQPLANAENNDCENAEIITVTITDALRISTDYTNANESLDASCNTASQNNNDLWYQFTMPIDGNLFIDTRNSSNYLTLYSTCGGAEIACSRDDTSFGNLINGNTYLLRVSNINNVNIEFFTIQAIVPAPNNVCDNRETLVLSTETFAEPNPDFKTATLSMDASCDSSPTFKYTDVWYDFVMPVDGNLNITSTNSRQTFTLYDACSGTELQCFNGSRLVLFQGLTESTTYILRAAQVINSARMDFKIQPLAIVSNDECNGSETLIIETENPITYNVDLLSATESEEVPCRTTGARTSYDLWYNFTMPVTGSVKIDQLGNTDIITVYDACSGIVLSCQPNTQFITGLTAGVNYTLRIASITQEVKTPRFQAFAAAPNDECENSETITVTTNNALSYEADTRHASESLKASCESSFSNNLDLWYDFEMPVTGNIQFSSANNSLVVSLFDACSGNEVGCLRRAGTFTNLGLNINYKLKISHTANSAANISFNIQAFENLFNDECVTPQDITVPIDEFATYSTNNAAATSSVTTTCERSGIINDVWYRFTMPNSNDIEIDDLTSNITGYFALYDACGTTELQCLTNDGVFTDLTEGNQYLLKVGNPSFQTGVLNFNISAKTVGLSNEEFNINDIKTYPNPVADVLHIKLPRTYKTIKIKMYNTLGQEIESKQFNNLQNVQWDCKESKGIYFIKIQLDEVHNSVIKVIKQ